MGTVVKDSVKLALDAAQISNGAKEIIEAGMPYRVTVTIKGVAPIMFHAWNTEAVKAKGEGPKGSTGKKTDDVESYVYRDSDGNLGVEGVALRAALVNAARYIQDPRSPRKSGMDLVKAGIVPLTVVAPFEPATAKWDYEDARRAVVQRASITRIRPCMREGWTCTFDLMVNTPEYITPVLVAKLLNDAGRLCGLLDMRPTYGRFTVVHLECGAL